MYKQAPSRSHRSKFITGKHILQIGLLLAVCFWLIYQVKHSHEQKHKFEGKDEKFAQKKVTDGEIDRLGRKDLPRVTEIATDVEEHEEEEQENEPEEEEEEKTHSERVESDRIGGRDSMLIKDKPEQTEVEEEHVDEEAVEESEKSEETDVETGHEDGSEEEIHTENEENDDVTKDLPETEENENAETEEHDENDDPTLVEDQEHEGEKKTTHEAQEELYKADDASSEVAQNVQTVVYKSGNVNFGNLNETQNFEEPNKAKNNVTVSNYEKLPENSKNSTDNVIMTSKNTTSYETREDQSSNEGTETTLHDPIDESDDIDIITHPEIANEVQKTDESVAE